MPSSPRVHAPHPALVDARLDELIEEMGHAAWFASCGEPLSETERAEAQSYAAALGFEDLPVASVAEWRAAAEVTQRPDWSREWWQRESEAEAELRATAEARFGAAPLLAALSRITDAAAALDGAAAMAVVRGGIADAALTRVAAGAAAQACHQAALARAAGAGADHAFAAKYRLFAAGRWPLGVVGGRLFVF